MVTTKANKSTKQCKQNISYLDWALPKTKKRFTLTERALSIYFKQWSTPLKIL